MAELAESAAGLRIGGDDLDPQEITKLLGCEPTYSRYNGETWTSGPSKKVITAKGGIWILDAVRASPANLDAQIEEILGKLVDNLDVWRSLNERFDLDLSCGLFMEVTNEGLAVSVESLSKLSDRGIDLSLDIFGVIPEPSTSKRDA